jgi:hypothetical protein
VQALLVERQPDPESPRMINRHGPKRVGSKVVDYSRAKNGFNRSHWISCVVHNHFCRHQETVNKTTANLHQAAVISLPWRSFVYLCTSRDHILRHSRVREGTVASPSPGCRVRFSGQLLMLTYTSPFSGESQQYYVDCASRQSATTSSRYCLAWLNPQSIVSPQPTHCLDRSIDHY